MGKKKRRKHSEKRQATPVWGTFVDWTLDEAGRLVAVDEVEHRLAIEQSNGKFTFLGHKGTGPGEFHYPKCVEILNGTAYVVDSWNHRVQLFRLPDWKFVGSFGGRGEGTSSFFCPSWITVVDRENEEPWLVVADANNSRLTFHDSQGAYLFGNELFNSRRPTKVRTREGRIEVRYEDRQWDTVL